MVEILNFREDDAVHWDEYVCRSKEATFYHQLGWKKVVEKTLAHKPYYLIARENNTVKGVLPLFLVKSLFFGASLISIPAANYGGVCADNTEVRCKLIKQAQMITEDLGVDFLEFRDVSKDKPHLGWEEDLSHVSFLIPLSSNPKEVWRSLQKKARQKVRKALRSGLRVCWDSVKLKEFYNVYCLNMKRLGSPPFGLEFFKGILAEFSDEATLVFVKYKGRVIAGDLVVFFKDRMMSLYAGTLKNYLPLCPNNLICWKEIEYGCKNGYSYYDFGRSQRGSGSFDFKKYWNGQIQQLHYHYYLNRASRLPKRDPCSPKYRFYAQIWKRLPFSLSRYVGTKIVRYLH